MTILTLLNRTLTTAINKDIRVGILFNDTFQEIETTQTQTIEVPDPKSNIMGNKEEVLILGKYYSNKDDNYLEF